MGPGPTLSPGLLARINDLDETIYEGAELEEELHRTRARLETARERRRKRRCEEQRVVLGAAIAAPPMWATALSKESVLRYARQLLVSALGAGGHAALARFEGMDAAELRAQRRKKFLAIGRSL